jgi:hypothetical protein
VTAPRGDPASQSALSVGIVGGGIGGLYCARKLLERGHAVRLFEMLERVGGRIETEPDLAGFTAEFGPMRFEPKLQPLFTTLCGDLRIDLVEFPGPKGARDAGETKVALPPDERAGNNKPLGPLDLLKLGVVRMFDEGDERLDRNGARYLKKREGWLSELDLLPRHVPEDWKRLYGPPPSDGPRDANATSADDLRKNATVPSGHTGIEGMPWRDLGLWNALSEVLSHQAIIRIRDFGTFYHLIPENPNAVEWAIFWLRLFQLGKKEPAWRIGRPDLEVARLDHSVHQAPD